MAALNQLRRLVVCVESVGDGLECYPTRSLWALLGLQNAGYFDKSPRSTRQLLLYHLSISSRRLRVVVSSRPRGPRARTGLCGRNYDLLSGVSQKANKYT